MIDELPAGPQDIFLTLKAYRKAARTITRDEALGKERKLALVKLLQKARDEYGEDDWLSAAIQQVIYSEAKELIVRGVTPTAPAPAWQADPVNRKLQMMVHEGFDRCPECRRPLPDLDTLAEWDDRDRAIWLELAHRENAVDV